MLAFQTSDPFPLIGPHKESEIFHHASLCGGWLDLRVSKIENELSTQGCRLRAPRASGEKQQIWIGLEPQMLLTPYTEIRSILEKLCPRAGQTVVDLGAAYGRMGFVLARHFPKTNFVGYEYVGERVHEANRALSKFGATRAMVEHADLASPSFVPPYADIYFLYDFGTPKAIEKILYDLRRLNREITLVVRGRHCRYMIDRQHSWLRNAFPEESEGRVTIYRHSEFLEIPAAV